MKVLGLLLLDSEKKVKLKISGYPFLFASFLVCEGDASATVCVRSASAYIIFFQILHGAMHRTVWHGTSLYVCEIEHDDEHHKNEHSSAGILQ